MQIKRNNSSKKKLSVIIIAALLILGCVAVFLYVRLNHSAVDSKPAKEISSDKQQAKNLQNDADNKNKTPNTDEPATPTTPTTSSKKVVQVTSSTDMSDGMVFIRGGIDYPLTDGNCYAQLSGPSNQSIRKDTTILKGPSSTDCKTISIPVAELAPGKWTFTLHYASDGYEGVSNEISFSV